MLMVTYTEIRWDDVGTIYEYTTTIECNICKIYLNHVDDMPPYRRATPKAYDRYQSVTTAITWAV